MIELALPHVSSPALPHCKERREYSGFGSSTRGAHDMAFHDPYSGPQTNIYYIYILRMDLTFRSEGSNGPVNLVCHEVLYVGQSFSWKVLLSRPKLC